MTRGRRRDWLSLDGLRRRLGRGTSTQLVVLMTVVAALALTGSLYVTGAAVRTDQREQAALAALDDYGSMVQKLGIETGLGSATLTEGDTAFLAGWLATFQSGNARGARTLEETCRTGRGGAGVRYIRSPVGPPVGLAALATTPADRAYGLGEDVYVIALEKGVLCPDRAVEVVAVRRPVGPLDIIVGRVVDRSGEAWGRAVIVVLGAGLALLAMGLGAAAFARQRLTRAVAEVSQALDRAGVGDFSLRAPKTAVAPELTELTGHVNGTLDRLEELLSWLRDSADQLAHDFRTPLARATARLDRLKEAELSPEALRLAQEVEADLTQLTRAMNEAMTLRDGEAWVFETVRLDELGAAAAELYDALAEDRGVTIRVEAEPVQVLGVRSLLLRAVTNLVDNAVKFSPEGSTVTLTVGMRDDRPFLTVADQGAGFAAEALSDPAVAVARAVAQGRESHGMGLAFVRTVLKRHGASMTIGDAAPGAVVTAQFSR